MHPLHGKLVFPIKWGHEGAQNGALSVEKIWVCLRSWRHLMGRIWARALDRNPGIANLVILITLGRTDKSGESCLKVVEIFISVVGLLYFWAITYHLLSYIYTFAILDFYFILFQENAESSPGLVVIIWDSCSEGCGLESQHHTLDGDFSLLFVVKIVMFGWKGNLRNLYTSWTQYQRLLLVSYIG